jgi:alcohol dehydrogenase (quinone), cytochrome c subunit
MHFLRCCALLGALLLGHAGLAQERAPQAAATPSPVERGMYLANVGNCVSCHTRPHGQPFAGGVMFQTPVGTIYSTNITPDAQTGIGKWSAADLRRAMHEGITPDGAHLFPAFPYTSFTKVSDADVDDIYAYLRTLTPVRYTPPSNGSLFSVRWPLALWNKMFFREGRLTSDPKQSTEWNRGAYLVEGLGHCSACHTPRNLFLAEQPDNPYLGGEIQDAVAKDKVRPWFAVNLTSQKHGLGSWSVADLAKYFQTGVSLRAGTFGPMNEVIVNSLKRLTPADAHAMAVYVKSLEGPEYAGEEGPPTLMTAGAAIYKERCEKCHGSSGRGGFFSGPPLDGSAVAQANGPASLINIILYGPAVPEGMKFGGWETMPSYADILNDEQVAAVSNFVRGSWGNRAAPVGAAQVSKQR